MEPGRGYVRRVTRGTLQEFKRFLRTGDESAAEAQSREGATRNDEAQDVSSATDGDASSEADADSPFGPGNPLLIASQYRSHPRRLRRRQYNMPSASPGTQATSLDSEGVADGKLLWRKLLSRTDAQRQGGNPTGDLRLTQARFREGGQVIDQTTYFREDVFADFLWRVEGSSEVAEVAFSLTVFGQDWGVSRLEISHKPSGEAGQGNYTTNIRWGPLGDRLRNQVDVTGARLELYEGSNSDEADFRIVIT